MKYSVGQKVKIHSLEWYQDNVNRYGIIECGKYEFFEPMNEYCGKVVTIKRIDDDNYRIDADKGAFCWTDEMIEGLVEEEIEFTEEDKYWCDIMSESDPTTYVLPEGYIFKDENGNVINATKIVLEKKKKEYPKTYDECCKVLNTDDDSIIDISVPLHYNHLLISFTQLLICRDAYWKIAGREMGLNRPWEPIFDIDSNHFVITVHHGEIESFFGYTPHDILVFPTEEMRDAFYENFKELIKQCKELL